MPNDPEWKMALRSLMRPHKEYLASSEFMKEEKSTYYPELIGMIEETVVEGRDAEV